MMKKTLVGLSLACVLAIAGCGKETTTEETITRKPVITEKVELRRITRTFTSDAVLEPKAKIDHITEKGGTVAKILKRNGDTVAKGEAIMQISDPATEATYNSAKASYDIALNNYTKFKKLYNGGMISYLEYAPYENTYTSAKAAYDSAKGDYDKLLGKSPIDGVVGNIFDKEGNKVQSQNTVFTVVDESSMETYVGFPAESLSEISVGLEVQVYISALDKTFVGKITEINPIADSVTKKYKIKISVDNTERQIKDGMYANVTIPAGEGEVLSMSDQGIFIRDLVSYAYKVVDGQVTRVRVKVGATNLPYTEISSDELQPGDTVVKDGLFSIGEGDYVEEATK